MDLTSAIPGSTAATIVPAMGAYLLVIGGWLVLVPFALATAIVVGLVLYLRWLRRPVRPRGMTRSSPGRLALERE